MATLELRNLTKKFGDFVAVNDISLSISQGEVIALLGGSGCGKTTTLRMIAGFTEPFSGMILVDGKDVGKIPPYKRNIGYFFQNYALFPHMTVFENVAFGLKLKKLPKTEIAQRVDDMLAMVKLTGLNRRYPRELSGGQQQRVALARALVTRPEILLLDEPLSNLDAKLRAQMQVEIKRIQKELNITTIIVTHDQNEAVSLADRVIVMNAGTVLQIGSPHTIFQHPASVFIADFMGFSTFIHGTVAASEGDRCVVACGRHKINVSSEAARRTAPGDAVVLAIRSENMELAHQTGENTVEGCVDVVVYKGQATHLEVSGCFEETIYPAVSDYIEYSVGDPIFIRLPADRLCIYKINEG